jgi:hypothetical protein
MVDAPAKGGYQMAKINHWASKHFQFHQKSTIMNRQSSINKNVESTSNRSRLPADSSSDEPFRKEGRFVTA